MQEILRAAKVTYEGLYYPEISVTEGQVTFLQGPSGSGKTTLCKLFNATVSAQSGIITYRGEPLDSYDSVRLRQEVLLVSQSVYLFSGSIEENFVTYYSYRHLPRPTPEEIRFFLKLCQVPFKADALCDTLSGGERQRVYIAICLSLAPLVLMLDEPTSALDKETARLLLENLRNYAKEQAMTLLVISHDEDLSKVFADRVIRLGKEGTSERCH